MPLRLLSAWRWCRRHALALVAGLVAVLGLVAYALGRRRPSATEQERERRAAGEAGRAEGRAEVHAEDAAGHVAAADQAHADESALAAEQAHLRELAARRRAAITGEDAAAVSRELNALAERRAQRQRERGRP